MSLLCVQSAARSKSRSQQGQGGGDSQLFNLPSDLSSSLILVSNTMTVSCRFRESEWNSAIIIADSGIVQRTDRILSPGFIAGNSRHTASSDPGLARSAVQRGLRQESQVVIAQRSSAGKRSRRGVNAARTVSRRAESFSTSRELA